MHDRAEPIVQVVYPKLLDDRTPVLHVLAFLYGDIPVSSDRSALPDPMSM